MDNLYKNALENISYGIVIINHDGDIVYTNRANYESLGETHDIFTGQNVLSLLQADRTDTCVFQVIKNTLKPVYMRQKYVNSFGDTFEMMMEQTPIVENGELKYSVGVCHKATKLIDVATAGTNIQNKYTEFVYADQKMKEVFQYAERVASFDVNIIIQGETGSGKDIIVDYIHDNSKYKTGKLVKVNCATISENLLETELFGYKGGSFTGSKKEGSEGLVHEAENGTLFLDEINSLPLSLQGKILYLIENKKYRPVGSIREFRSNARIIVASNENLSRCVRKGTFRQDLFFRLNTVTLEVPPLRNRKKDIPIITEFYLQKYNNKYGKQVVLSNKIQQELMDYNWPGNIRELKNLIERIVIDGEEPWSIQKYKSEYAGVYDKLKELDTPPKKEPESINTSLPHKSLATQIEECERNIIINYLKTGLSNNEIAAKLEINPATLSRKISKYGIRYKL